MLDNEQCRTVIPMKVETNEVNPMIAQLSAWKHSKNHDARMGCPCRIRHSCRVEKLKSREKDQRERAGYKKCTEKELQISAQISF